MAAKQEMNKNTANNMNCSLCTKFIKILKHKPEGETELKCDECSDDSDPVVALCVECELYLCKVCHDYHRRKRTTHDLVSLSSIAGGIAGQSSERNFYCPANRKNEQDYYCETCDKLLCIYCATKEEHGEHMHELVEKMASKHRGVLAEVIAPIEEKRENLSKAEDKIVSMQEWIKEQVSEIDQEIDKCYVEQLQKLNEHCKQLKKQLRDAVSPKEKALSKQLNDMEPVQDELTKLTQLREGLETTTDCKVLSIRKQDVENRVQRVNNHYKTLNMQPVEFDALEFAPAKTCTSLLGDLFTGANPHTSNVADLPGIVYCGCKVKFKIMAKDSKGKDCIKRGSQVCVQLKSFTGDVTAGEVRDNNDGSYMASFVAEQVGETKLSVAINGEQIKGSPYSIVVSRDYKSINPDVKPLKTMAAMGGAYGVAYGRNGLWAVADTSNHRVHIFDDKDKDHLVKTFGGSGSGDYQFSNPHGVAFDSHNHLYVADTGNHRVQKFDTNGRFLMQFGSKGTSDGQLIGPFGVTIHDDKLYIADKGNKRISVFTGQFCFTFCSDNLTSPCDVAVSPDNKLLVADCDTHGICKFTLDGCYLGKFATRGSGRGQLDKPHSLTTDLNGSIIVADTGNCRVSIFDKHGYWIQCFGSKGSSDGQFSNPHGVAVSPNGSIYVSDYNTKRVQIF